MTARSGRRRPPAPPRPPGGARRRAPLLPLAYLVVRAAGGGGRGWRILGRQSTVELVLQTGALVLAVDGRDDRRRRAPRLARDAHRPPGPALLGGSGGPAARDPELRCRVLPARRVRAEGPAPEDPRRRAPAGDLRLLGRARGAHPLDVPVRLPAHRGRAPRARPRARGGRSRARALASAHVRARDAPRSPAGDRLGSAARRALHPVGLRRRVAHALRGADPGDLPPVPVALRPNARGGARTRARRADRARALVEGRTRRGGTFRSGPGTARRAPTVALGRWKAPALAFCATAATFFLVIPAAVLGYWLARGVELRRPLGFPWEEAAHSLLASSLAAAVAVAAALPVAVLARGSPRGGPGGSSGPHSPRTRFRGS